MSGWTVGVRRSGAPRRVSAGVCKLLMMSALVCVLASPTVAQESRDALEGCDEPCQAALERVAESVGLKADHGPFELISITPYFQEASHPYHKAHAAMAGRRPDCKRALKHLDEADARCGEACEGRQALALLRSRALWCSGQKAQAHKLVKALDERGYPGMEREVRELHRRWARSLGEPRPEALQPSLAVEAERYLKSIQAQARQLARDGHTDAAVRLLRAVRLQIRKRERSVQLVRMEGNLLRKAGRLEEAAAVYLSLWRQNPRSALGQSMMDALDALEKEGLKASPLGPSERLERLTHLAARGQRRAVRDARRDFAARYKLRGRDVRALRDLCEGVRQDHERDRDKALVTLRKAEATARHPALVARVLFAKARVLRRLDRDDEAIATYKRLLQGAPRDHVAPEALYQKSRLALFLGRADEARAAMTTLVAEYPESARLADGLWQAAWATWLTGDAAAALPLLETLAEHHGDEVEKSGLSYELKATYWKARCLAKLGRTAEAVDGLRFVIERWPLTYYAAQAWHRIEALGVDPRQAVPFHPRFDEPITTEKLRALSVDDKVPAHPRVRRGLELWRLGRRDAAKAALWVQLQFEGTPRAVVELLSTFHLLDDDIPASFWLAYRHGDFSVAPYKGNARLWGLAYPAPEALLEIAQKFGPKVNLDPMLAFAIIRHESGFKRGVKSNVGARGLMQIMPGSAKATRRLWFGGKGPSKLNDPRDNIQLGMTMLRMLDNYYVGNLPLAIAGYNAGSGVAERWYKQFNHLETDELVEQMTYPRTMAYAKKVIGSYYAYRVLYGDGTPPPIPRELPESLGTWGAPEGQQLLGLR